MNPRRFTLLPFPGTGPLPISISGHVFRQANTLNVVYLLLGSLANLEAPPPADRPSRRIGLWENTCFEFFIGPRDSARYWEFNLSPSGDWNVFRFETYRQGLFEEMAFASLPFMVRKQSGSLRLVLEIDLSIIVPADQALKMAVSAVLKTGPGDVTLWALTHPGPEADFHHSEGFIIKI